MAARPDEIERLYRESYHGFRRALATVTGSYESAHDAVQEGFARALARRKQYRGDASLAAWVWRITLRTALESRRNGSPLRLDEVLDPAPVEPEREHELLAALRALPPKRRLIVFLRYFADLSYAEIAEICGVSEGTVSATLTQAREGLAEALSEAVGG